MLGGGERLREGVDSRRGFGEKFHPYEWEDARELLIPKLEDLRERVLGVPEALRGERVIVEATLAPNYLASSWFPDGLLAAAQIVPIGSKFGSAEHVKPSGENIEAAPTKVLQLAVTPESLATISKLFEVHTPVEEGDIRNELLRFVDFAMPTDARVVGGAELQGNVDWEVVLHPSVDAVGHVSNAAQALVAERWMQLVNSLGGDIDVDYVRTLGGLTFMPVTLDAATIGEVAQFNPLRNLHPMPEVIAPPSSAERGARNSFEEPDRSGRPLAARPIAVFDQGVDVDHDLLAPFASLVDLTPLDARPEGIEHGTLATSAALYGPMFPGIPPTRPPANVDHFRIDPAPVDSRRSAYWVLDQIEGVLRSGNYSVASIGVGINRPVEENLVSRWTFTLDEIARSHGVLIFVAAGNATDGVDGARVRAPADGVNLVSVGAAVGDQSAWEPASFTCGGPGRSGARIQPTVYCFGGDEGILFYGAAPGGEISGDFGTSFSAPSAARSVVAMSNALDESVRNPTALRALAAHLSSPYSVAGDDTIGHGLIEDDLSTRLECRENSVTVVYQDDLKRASAVAYPLPLPPRELSGKWRIRWTVSYMTPVDELEPPEYACAGLEVVFRPHALKVTLTPPKGVSGKKLALNLADDSEVAAELIGKGWTQSLPVSKSVPGTKSEQGLRDEGKWETIIQREIGFHGKSLLQPRISLNYLARQTGVLLTGSGVPDLRVALAVTVTGPKDSGLYDEIRAAAPFNILAPIALDADIEIDTPAS